MRKVIKNILKTLGYEVVKQKSSGGIKYSSIKKILYYKKMLDMVKNVEGDVIECGIGGEESFAILAALIKAEGKGRKLWGFDSFTGFPDPTIKDESFRNSKKGEDKTSIREFYNFIHDVGVEDSLDSQISIVKGFFKDSLKKYKGKKIALLHLDVDLYESYLQTLQEFFPKVTADGVVLFDE